MEDEGESELDEEERPKKGNGAAGAGAAAAGGAAASGKQGAAVPDGELGEGGDPDLEVYCVCRQVGYGEMIGCDEDTCEIEWVSLGSSALDVKGMGLMEIVSRRVPRIRQAARGELDLSSVRGEEEEESKGQEGGQATADQVIVRGQGRSICRGRICTDQSFQLDVFSLVLMRD
jgi:hypothetical protein